jgi:hypothetical protein
MIDRPPQGPQVRLLKEGQRLPRGDWAEYEKPRSGLPLLVFVILAAVAAVGVIAYNRWIHDGNRTTDESTGQVP